jgi:hypothetical protein
MSVPVRLLQKHAERCLELAYRCRNKNAERILRLLATDLLLAAAHQQRPGRADRFAELRQLAELAAARA